MLVTVSVSRRCALSSSALAVTVLQAGDRAASYWPAQSPHPLRTQPLSPSFRLSLSASLCLD